ncbi:uncharacterized protein METZ01_LOCUS404861, partial [marine metagenome]
SQMVALCLRTGAQTRSILHETHDHSHRQVEFVKMSCQTDSETSKKDA